MSRMSVLMVSEVEGENIPYNDNFREHCAHSTSVRTEGPEHVPEEINPYNSVRWADRTCKGSKNQCLPHPWSELIENTPNFQNEYQLTYRRLAEG